MNAGRRSPKKQTGNFLYLSLRLPKRDFAHSRHRRRGIRNPSPPSERQTATAGWFKVRANEAVWPDVSGLGEADQWVGEHHFAP